MIKRKIYISKVVLNILDGLIQIVKQTHPENSGAIGLVVRALDPRSRVWGLIPEALLCVTALGKL